MQRKLARTSLLYLAFFCIILYLIPKGSGRKGATPPHKCKSKEPVVTHIGMSLSSDSMPTCGPNSLAHSHLSTIQSPNSSNISVQLFLLINVFNKSCLILSCILKLTCKIKFSI